MALAVPADAHDRITPGADPLFYGDRTGLRNPFRKAAPRTGAGDEDFGLLLPPPGGS
jgi:hypothetical protein